jgi:hypothetical protein
MVAAAGVDRETVVIRLAGREARARDKAQDLSRGPDMTSWGFM